MILKMFQDIFENKKFLSPQDLISMASITKIRRIKKGEHLARSGDINYLIVIVVKGLLRHYIIDEEGNEKTMLFVTEKTKFSQYRNHSSRRGLYGKHRRRRKFHLIEF